MEVSTNANYYFTADSDRDLVANFQPIPYQISATADPVEGGTVNGAGNYDYHTNATLTATPAAGYYFVNWTLNGNEVSTEASYTFQVTGAAALVAHFAKTPVSNTYNFIAGWNWWSANQEITLEQLESATENYSSVIVSQNGTADYIEGFGWDNTEFETLDLSKMYKMNFSEAVELTFNAPAANPTDHPIIIKNGSNWIGFPVQETMSVKDALAGLANKTTGDRIKSPNGYTTWLGSSWSGTLKNFEPGHGYIYVAKGSAQQTFTYPAASKGVESESEALNTTWTAQRARFASTMDLFATVEINGVEQTSDELEIGAFVGDECRGAVKLMYVEELGKHIAFLTVSGNNGETVSFKALHEGEVIDLQETVTIQLNELLGDAKAPFVLHANSGTFTLFPNPASKGEFIHMSLNDLNGATVEIYNALGALVRTETLSNENKELSGFNTAGVYTIRVVDQKGNVRIGKLVVK